MFQNGFIYISKRSFKREVDHILVINKLLLVQRMIKVQHTFPVSNEGNAENFGKKHIHVNKVSMILSTKKETRKYLTMDEAFLFMWAPCLLILYLLHYVCFSGY